MEEQNYEECRKYPYYQKFSDWLSQSFLGNTECRAKEDMEEYSKIPQLQNCRGKIRPCKMEKVLLKPIAEFFLGITKKGSKWTPSFFSNLIKFRKIS